MRLSSILVGSILLAACGDSSSSANDSGEGGSVSSSMNTGGSSDGSAAQYCVDKINAYRATLGLPPYGRWTSAEGCTDGEAMSDGTTGTPHGAFGTCMESAQNECPGWSGAYETVMDGCLDLMWAEGPGDFAEHGHFVNMSSTSYTEVACGFATLPDGSVWAAQNFH